KDLKSPDTELPFLIELRADAPVALYPIRLRGADGISNVLIFSVSDFPEIELRKEKSESGERPVTALRPPIVVGSTLEAAEVDRFRLQARAGESLVFEVEARRIGSAIDPVIAVLDSAGREVAANDDAPGLGADARVEVKFPRDGEYRVVVHD